MTVKWGSTTCTVIKWGSTTCTAVYWGSTKVFPDTFTFYINYSSTSPQASSGHRYNSTFTISGFSTTFASIVDVQATSITKVEGSDLCNAMKIKSASTSAAYVSHYVTSKSSWYTTYQIYTNSGKTSKAISTTSISNGSTFYY